MVRRITCVLAAIVIAGFTTAAPAAASNGTVKPMGHLYCC